MRKSSLLALISAFCMAVPLPQSVAQPHSPVGPHSLQYESATFIASHGETFTVYIDGDPVNRAPQSRVLVNNLSRQPHEVVVILRRPADKATTMHLLPSEPNVIVTVEYDKRSRTLNLLTHPANIPGSVVYSSQTGPLPSAPGAVGMGPRAATDEEVGSLVRQLKAKSFDRDRLSLAYALLPSSRYTSLQIARMARTIDFSSSQVDFLKFAYSYCVDPHNYGTAIEVLTFESDRRKVADYIAGQH